MQYNERLLQHFFAPKNVGHLADANGIGKVGDPSCGDFLIVWLKVEDDTIVDIRFKTHGCPAAIATASIMTEMAKGESVEEALGITDEKIEEALGGLPGAKSHCSNLAATALYEALLDYSLRKAHGESAA